VNIFIKKYIFKQKIEQNIETHAVVHNGINRENYRWGSSIRTLFREYREIHLLGQCSAWQLALYMHCPSGWSQIENKLGFFYSNDFA